MAKSETLVTLNAREDGEQQEHFSLLMRVKMIQSHWKTLWQFHKTEYTVPYDPAVMPLMSLSKGPENYLLTKLAHKCL